ncbi:MAG: lipoyl(octanoyl) transferase LipB [Dehalococcoidia bacterium]|nr:lipoyl(octanoyl) transferase LipB [Dehalococcoidia bacterium]
MPHGATEVTLHRATAVDYDAGRAWQHAAWQAVLDARHRGVPAPEALALVEHTPVYTMGARGGRRHLLAAPAALQARGARVVDTDRGGDITFHGPGQLVAYPILDLNARGLRAADYVRALEQCVIDSLAPFGIEGSRRPGYPGVWVDDRGLDAKVAAVGVRIQRGVSRHGLALNVTTDLAWFDAIVPCGIAGAPVTSMARVLDAPPDVDRVLKAFSAAFERVFDAVLVEPSLSDSLLPPPGGGAGAGGEGVRPRIEVPA